MLFSAAAAQEPIQFGPYLLTECVGQGGMAVVYKATRRGPNGFEKTVVVKAMLPTLSAQKEFVAMFSAEARLMAALSHPNIVQVHDFGVVDGIPYLAMEYLAGRNLSQMRAALAASNIKLPVGAALTIAREMCHGLAYAHEFVDADGRKRNIIHRDVSPSNVMVCRDGSIKLLDFGVAKIVGELDFDATQSFKGKYAYMAPEQVNHKPFDRRVDVFAAGIVLHELLTGKRLFAAQTELETLQRVSAAQVIAPSVDNHEVPRQLDHIVKRALARDPRDRYASGGELAEALETLDSMAWPRKRLAVWVAEMFAHDWMVVCDVCGKQVLQGAECIECGTEAPEPVEKPVQVALDARARSARQAIVPLLGPMETDRVDLAASEQPATIVDEPQPLPPPPLASRKQAAARARLSVVRTPLPTPATLACVDEGLAAAPEPKTDRTMMPLVEDADDDAIDDVPTSPPKLFVVPRPEAPTVVAVPHPPTPFAMPHAPANPPAAADSFVALEPPKPYVAPAPFVEPEPPPLAPAPFADPARVATPMSSSTSGVRMPMSPLATPRPSAPQPLFVLPNPPVHFDLPDLRGESRLVWWAMGAAALAIVVLAATLILRSSSAPSTTLATTPPAVTPVEPTLAPPPVEEPPPPKATPLPPTATPEPKATRAPTVIPLPQPLVVEASKPPVSKPVVATRPPRRRVARPRPAPVADETERTVKEGRIVDPFAGLK